jgi:hypothetical protein
MRRLKCKYPRSVKNFIRLYKVFLEKHNLMEGVKALEETASYPLSTRDQQTLEEWDKLRCEGVEKSEHRCRKLKAGQVAFSPSVKLSMDQIQAWSLLMKRAQGGKVSAWLLDRTLKKVGVNIREKIMGSDYLQEQMKAAYERYYLMLRVSVRTSCIP